MEITNKTPADDYDSPWKEVLGHFFPAFVQFFMPDLYEDIDWKAGYEFLEQELREMLRDAETGPRRVDKVVKVHLLTGESIYVILHVEIQVTRESGFPQRMFVYFYRLYDIYPEQVVSLAILADEEPGWEPKRYKNTKYRTHLMFGYRTVKLWKYNGRWSELENDPNPMALVVMAHLKTKATRDDGAERLRWKIELVCQLYARGYTREDIHELFRFIDWILVLPRSMTASFRERVEQIDQEARMKYVTSIERLYLEEGRKEGSLGILLSQVEEKFGPLDDSLRKTVEEATLDQVMNWAKRLISASSLDEVFAT